MVCFHFVPFSLPITLIMDFLFTVGMWVGMTDEEKEGSFIDPNTKEVVLNQNGGFNVWLRGEPNGQEAENCVIQFAIEGTWVDYPCGDPSIGSCYLEHMPPQFKLRGKVFAVWGRLGKYFE